MVPLTVQHTSTCSAQRESSDVRALCLGYSRWPGNLVGQLTDVVLEKS